MDDSVKYYNCFLITMDVEDQKGILPIRLQNVGIII